jgi:hypothetical protein
MVEMVLGDSLLGLLLKAPRASGSRDVEVLAMPPIVIVDEQ